MRANQLRLWFASFAYVLLEALRRNRIAPHPVADATCGTIPLTPQARRPVMVSVRRIKVAIALACPYRTESRSPICGSRARPGRRPPAPPPEPTHGCRRTAA